MLGGRIVIFSAPSGAGKTTIVRNILKFRKYNLAFSISATSRKPRKGEVDGKDYYFISVEEFKAKIRNQEFIEWVEVYENQFYGTLKSEIERLFALGKNVIFDVDVVGGLEIKKVFKEIALAIFIMPPSINELERRLIDRGTENEQSIRKRIERANFEISLANKFDVIIVNDDLQKAINQTCKILDDFLLC